MTLNILFVEDDDKLRPDLIKIFNNSNIAGHTIIAHEAETFEKGIELIKSNDYDLAILDLYRGDPKEGNEKMGLEVLKEIQANEFIPVIFYSGLTNYLVDLASQIIGVVNKGDGIEKLQAEIERIFKSNIGLIKGKIHEHIQAALKDYFWEIVDKHKDIFGQVKDDISLGYLLLRRLSNSLSKENIKILLGDDKIDPDKAHPMEYYIFPTPVGEYEAGEILKKDNEVFIILTPSCDFIENSQSKRARKVGWVLLAHAIRLRETQEYSRFKSNPGKHLDSLKKLIETRKGDRYFFLPGTPFLENLVVDFQEKQMALYENLSQFTRIARLDEPFAQSLVASFIRYYNRIGFPDIDADYIIRNL
jgi:hypothetical protein